MTNPFSLLPYVLAASGTSVGGISTNTLVAAGFTLLQRSAPLVRALASSRPALLLPAGAATTVTALAACDGHVALVVHHSTAPESVTRQLTDACIGVVFTCSTMVTHLPSEMRDDLLIVLLDDVPRHARVRTRDTERIVDLGSHVGLSLEGHTNEPLSDDAVLSWIVDGTEVSVSHAQTMAGAGPLSWLSTV